jgi:hypothetical protein
MTAEVLPDVIREHLFEHRRNWRLIRAVATDSTGRHWVSEAPVNAPSWADGEDML